MQVPCISISDACIRVPCISFIHEIYSKKEYPELHVVHDQMMKIIKKSLETSCCKIK